MSGTTLLVATGSYPWDVAVEGTFLGPELEHLAAAFDRVVLVPAATQGSRAPLPAGVEVDVTFAALRESISPRAAGKRGAREPRLVLPDLRRAVAAPTGIKRLLVYAGHAGVARAWMRAYLRRPGVNAARTLVYTYWLSEVTLGMGLARHPGGHRVVSRVHGMDVYEERSPGAYLPARRATLGVLDHLFTMSGDARRYVAARYPAFAPPAETRPLGVPDPGFRTAPSDDGVLRVMSCAYVVPVKRLELLARGVERLARARPGRRVEWTHVGGGPGLDALRALAAGFPANAAARFTDSLPNRALLALYRGEPVDVFVNVSASEGIPVTIMEAAACGIPAVATAVGGNPEIVGAENGFLLSADPSPDEVAAALGRFWDAPALRTRLGDGARAVWSARFDARRTGAGFAARLAELAAGGPAPARSVRGGA